MLNICQVSLKENIPTILENYENFIKFYKICKFIIICPQAEKNIFEKYLKEKNFEIISEEKIIDFNKFKLISNEYFVKKVYYNSIQSRLKWYYQQVLKISFLLDFVKEKNDSMVIWDADTIILKKIKFFENESTKIYGTTSEYFKAYFKTNFTIFGTQPKYFVSSLTQFTSLNFKEKQNLISYLKKFMDNSNIITTGEWISHVVSKSIADTHDDYNGSLFSEYEMIAHSKMLNNKKNQELVSGIREDLSGKLSKLQIFLIRFLNYKYVAYEFRNNQSQNKDKKETWMKFLKLIIKKTSNKIFRGIKHHFFLIIK